MLLLRQFAMFGSVELGELAMLADNVVEQTFAAGTTIARIATRPTGVHLVVSGNVARAGHESLGPRSVIGALEVFARRDMMTTAIAQTETRTLKVHPTDLAELLEDNFGLMRATVRDLAARLVTHVPPAIGAPIVVVPGAALGLVERLLVLRNQLAFSGVHLEALAALAHNAEEVRWPAGTIVAREGEPPLAAYFVAEGELRVGASGICLPGSAIGALEMLAEVRHAETIVAVTDTRAVAVGASALFDVVEDHTDLGLGMIASFANALLGAQSTAS